MSYLLIFTVGEHSLNRVLCNQKGLLAAIIDFNKYVLYLENCAI